jgi:hypothetical protein
VPERVDEREPGGRGHLRHPRRRLQHRRRHHRQAGGRMLLLFPFSIGISPRQLLSSSGVLNSLGIHLGVPVPFLGLYSS